MQSMFRTVLVLTLLLSACSAIPATHQTSPSATMEPASPLPTTAVPIPKPIRTLGTPHIEQGPDGAVTVAPPNTQNCGYQWAYQDLPRVSSNFQQTLQALQADAQGSAFAFGENCILPDGSVGDFLPMETDFKLTLQTSNLNDETELGGWIIKVMEIIAAVPPDQIVGPRPGRVTITFQSNANQKVVNFYINQYQELPSGLSPAEIYQALQGPQ